MKDLAISAFAFLLACAPTVPKSQQIAESAVTNFDPIGGPIVDRQSMCDGGRGLIDLRDRVSSLSDVERPNNSSHEAVRKNWNNFISAYKTSDEIYRFTISGYQGRPFSGGYAISRAGCVVAIYSTWIS